MITRITDYEEMSGELYRLLVLSLSSVYKLCGYETRCGFKRDVACN